MILLRGGTLRQHFSWIIPLYLLVVSMLIQLSLHNAGLVFEMLL